MAKNTKVEKAEATVEEAVSKTESFFINYGKTLSISLVAVLVLCIAAFAYYQWIYTPQANEAKTEVAHAEQAFQADDFKTALNGDGEILGFAQIITEYGSKGGEIVYLYAGICELQLGNYESAIEYLKEYDGDDDIMSARALACIGDSYTEIENYTEALKYFEAAANTADNLYAAEYLFKAGAVAEKLGDEAKALECYKAIKENYLPELQQATMPYIYQYQMQLKSEILEIDKYISKLENK